LKEVKYGLRKEIIATDFDRLASAKLMIKTIPPELPRSTPALDIDCNMGELCRLLAERFDKVRRVFTKVLVPQSIQPAD
jgi:hypothetical protein